MSDVPTRASDPIALILDSEPGAARTQKVLRRLNFSPQIAGNLEDALRLAAEGNLAAVVVSLAACPPEPLPALQRLAEANRAVPVILLVEEREDELGLQALSLGIQDCLIRSKMTPRTMALAIRQATARAKSRIGAAQMDALLDEKVSQRTEELRTTVEALHKEIANKRLAEEELARNNRELRMLLACDEAIGSSRNQQELVNKICGLIVETGSYPAAWIGWAVNNNGRIEVASTCGLDEECIRQAPSGGETAKPSPAVEAIETGEPYVCRDFVSDSELLPWKQAAHRKGFQSSISLPLKPRAGRMGIMTVYSCLPDGFDDGRDNALRQLADRVTLALASFGIGEECLQVADQVVGTLQEKQQQIGRDLNVRIRDALAGVQTEMETLKKKMSGRGARLKSAETEIDRIREVVAGTVQQLGHFVQELCPVDTNEGALARALEQLAKKTSETHHVECLLEIKASSPLPGPPVTTHLYYIASEVIANAVTRAGATKFRIGLKEDDGCIELSVDDNGPGLPDKPGENKTGIHTVSCRARMIGATVYMAIKEDGGRTFRCSLPMNPAPIQSTQLTPQ